MEAMEMICPFCEFEAEGDYQIMLHIETLHPENGDESPFMANGVDGVGGVDDNASLKALKANDDASWGEREGEEDDYVQCPQEGCGEALLLVELEGHVEMHEQERDGSDGDEMRRVSSKRVKLDGEGKGFGTGGVGGFRNLGDGGEGETKETRERREHEAYEKQFGDRSLANRKHLESENGGDKSKRRRKMSNGEPEPSPSKKSVVVAAWRNLLNMPLSERKAVAAGGTPARKRLGRAQLGPHAHEKSMPTWLVKLLEADGAYETAIRPGKNRKMKEVKWCPNMTSGIVPVVEQLVQMDVETEYAYLCDPAVRHVSKLKREGGFCGYRNIQMMVSYMIGAKAPGHEVFKDKIPSIFEIQEHIETAWDFGINASGRIETGGIRGTRKYIGTPEAQAMLLRLGIKCNAQGIKAKRDSGISAYENLYDIVESYFTGGYPASEFNKKVRCTGLPSIYFQHPGHSLTIIGFERKVNGARNLLVFDPMFHDAPGVSRLVGEEVGGKLGKGVEAEDLLRAYRRGSRYLKRYNEFEILRLVVEPLPREEAKMEVRGQMQMVEEVRNKVKEKWAGK